MTEKALLWLCLILGLSLVAVGTDSYFTKGRLKTANATIEAKDAAIRAQKREAQAKLDQLTVEANHANRMLREAQALQEKKDADAKSRIARLQRELDALGRLRDPNANGCGGGGGSSTPGVPQADAGGAADAAQTGGLLSAELSGLLRRLWREADEVNVAYASCRAQLTGEPQ